MEGEQSKRTRRGVFGLPDDRKLYWTYVPVLALIAVVFLGVGDDPGSDTKLQALTVLGLAGISILVCFYWAFSLRSASVSVVDYIKGTTASRTMLWFWAVFGGISLMAPLAGIGGRSLIPVWESAIWTFAGMGSVLLTAGPAYREYREAMGGASLIPLPGSGPQPAMDPGVVTASSVAGGRLPGTLLFAGLIAASVLAATARVLSRPQESVRRSRKSS